MQDSTTEQDNASDKTDIIQNKDNEQYNQSKNMKIKFSTEETNFKLKTNLHIKQKSVDYLNVFKDVNKAFINSENKKNSEKQILDYELIPFKKEETIYTNLDNNKTKNNFIESIFVAGLLPKNANVICDSENFTPTCCHRDCSILPSFRPEIIQKLPKENNSNFGLSNSVSFYFLFFRLLV